jgi:2-dehydro-3-deoxy-D-gluconate 5-dehydrogenase
MSSDKKFIPVSELIKLTGKKALVTGGAMGIGYAIAYRLAEAGAVVGIVDLNDERGQKAAQDIVSFGYQASFFQCDVSREEDVKKTVSAAISTLGGLDILVNNAGIFPSTPLLQLTSDAIEKIFSINLKGLLYFTREASRWMIEQKYSGCIINLASIDSLHPAHKGMVVYDASKGAVLTLTKSLAKDLGPSGIRVNAIAPGGILTEGALAQNLGGGENTGRAGLREFMSRLPLERWAKRMMLLGWRYSSLPIYPVI